MIEVDSSGFDDIRKRLTNLRDKIGDMSTVFADIGEQLLNSHDDRFEKEIAPDGSKWKLLSIDYLLSERKEESRGSNRILSLDGFLRKTMSYRASKTKLEFGSPEEYAAIQHSVRPFVGISKEDEGDIMDIISDYLNN